MYTLFTKILGAIFAEPSLAPFEAQFFDFYASIEVYVPFIIAAACLFVGLFGQRAFGFIRVVLFFAMGFVASVYLVAPIVTQYVPAIPGYLVGLAIGILAAVLSRMIYNFVFVGCIGFDVFNICVNALLLTEITSLTQGNVPVSLGIAAVAVIIALLLRKYMEMIVTAGIGGIGLAYAIKLIYDYTVFTALSPDTTMLFAGVIVAIAMFAVQYVYRIRY